MNILHKYSLKSLSKYRMRTIVTIIGIILSTSMITAITTLISSVSHYGQEISRINYGNWFVHISDVPYDIHNKLLDDTSISTIMSVKYEGYSLSDSQNEYKPYICVQSASSTFFENMPFKLCDGRLPENDTELLVPNHYFNYSENNYKVGDTITLTLGYRYTASKTHLGQRDSVINEITESPNIEYLEPQTTKTYTIVGICERPNFESYEAPGFSFFTNDQSVDNIPTDSSDSTAYYDEYVLLKKASNAIPLCKEYSNEYYSCTNSALLRYYGFSTNDTFKQILYNMGGILISIVIIGSITFIRNSFSISLSERIREFGLLSSIGTTKKQMKQIVRYEAIILCLIAVPIGIITGISGIGITLHFIKSPIESLFYTSDATAKMPSLSLHLSYISIIVTIALSTITVYISSAIPMKKALKRSAIDAISQRTELTINSKSLNIPSWVNRLFKFEGVITYKNYKRNKRNYRTIIFSLSMSIILFISTGAFSTYTLDRYNLDVSMSYYDLRLNGYMDYNEMPTFDSAYTAIKNSDAIEYSECFITQNSLYTLGNLTDDYKQIINDNIDGVTPINITFVDDDEYAALLKQYNLTDLISTTNYSDITTPILFNYFTKYEASYDSDYASPVICQVFTDTTDTLTLINDYDSKISDYIYDNRNSDITDNQDSHMLSSNLDSLQIKLAASITPDNYDDQPKTSHSTDVNTYPNLGIGPFLVYPLSAYYNILNNCYTFTNEYAKLTFNNILCTIKTKDYQKAITLIDNLTDNTGMSYQDLFQSEKENRSMLLMINILIYGFTTLISLICITNIFNTISTSMELRKREFAMLRSCGLSQKQFHKMLDFECLIYSIKGSLYGLISSTLICLFMYTRGMGKLNTFYLPTKYFIIAILFALILIYISIMYERKRLEHESIIDTLSKESI